MTATIALLPTLAVLVAVLGLRASGLQASALAAGAAVLIAIAAPFRGLDVGLVGRAVADAWILTLTAAAMIVPGVLFVEATRRQTSAAALAGLVNALDTTSARKALFVAVGLGVMIESLTGMGVSLLVTVPLLLALVPRREAIALALVGMSLMPWGALGISGIVGAQMAGIPLDRFAIWVARVSGGVAAILPLVGLAVTSNHVRSDWIWALALSAVMVAAISLASRLIGLELAGVVGGLAVIVVMLALSPSRDLATALKAGGLMPYATLLAAVVVQKLILAPFLTASSAPVLTTGRVSFALPASPGLALLATTLLASRRHLTGDVLEATLQRSWRPVAAIALFMISARLLVESGAIAALAGALSGLGRTSAAVVTVLLGIVSGFVTGSGVSGNALFMPAAAETGRALDALPLFAALQSGAAGHAAMASLPVGAILLAALPERMRDDDRAVLLTGLALVALYALVLLVIALVLLGRP